MEVRDLVYQGGGMIVAFDDNSVVHAVYKNVNGVLTLTGFAADQEAALERFNANASDTVNLDARASSPKVANQFQLMEASIQFLGEPYADLLANVPFTVPVSVTDANGVPSTFSSISSVTVNVTGGSASGKQLKVGDTLSAVDGSIVVPLVNGQGSVQVLATSTGDVDLSLTDSASSGLDVSDTATLTLS